MNKKIALALSAFAIFPFINFHAVAGQIVDWNQEITIKQPASQNSNDKKLSTIDKDRDNKVVTKGGGQEPSKEARRWEGNGKVPNATGLPTRKPSRPLTTSRANVNPIILSKANLSDWNLNKTKFIGLNNQIELSPHTKKTISIVTRKLNEIDRIMQRVTKLQSDPKKNKSALINASAELQEHEKIMKRLQQGLSDLNRCEDTYLNELEEYLQSVGDDAQLANVDLQNMLQKQQQTMQMMSNVSKMLHDTAMSIIRKIN